MAIFSGDIFAENYTVSSSVTNVQISSISGSTKSGDSVDDIHQFTGSLSVNGNVTLPSTSHKIGIGITPTEELHIGGGSSRVLLVHSTGGTTQIISRKDGNQIRLLANGANPILGYGNSSGGARNLLITSNDTTVATFTSGGDLLMSDGNDISGSSTSTGSFGHLRVDGEVSTQLKLRGSYTSTIKPYIRLQPNGSNSVLAFDGNNAPFFRSLSGIIFERRNDSSNQSQIVCTILTNTCIGIIYKSKCWNDMTWCRRI